MAPGRPTKRRSTARDTPVVLDPVVAADEEKTIPFLRRLCDMLEDPACGISFYPGCRQGGHTVLGRIVVHDRANVESEVLPKYFNHASFASLRRQLNYFSFTRVGKGRQRGATYCNEGVVELHDILRLKRRSVGSIPKDIVNHTSFEPISSASPVPSNDSHSEDVARSIGASTDTSFERCIRSSGIVNSVVPVVHISCASLDSTSSKRPKYERQAKKPTLAQVVSPLSTSPLPEDLLQSQQQRVVLDLTLKASFDRVARKSDIDSATASGSDQTCQPNVELSGAVQGDDDILEGCNALLSFSNGLREQVFA